MAVTTLEFMVQYLAAQDTWLSLGALRTQDGQRRRQQPWNTVSGNVQNNWSQGHDFFSLTSPLEGANVFWKLRCLCPDGLLINSSVCLRAKDTDP